MNCYPTAQSWVSAGFSVLPISYRGKRPAFDALKLTGGAPTWEQYQSRLPTDAELRLWFTGPRRNIGVVTGYRGLVVIDFDDRAAYDCWCSWADMAGGIAEEIAATTYRVVSARGVHLYVIVREPVESFKVGAIDVKAHWGYVLIPPSVHPSGWEYYGQGMAIMQATTLGDVFPLKPTPAGGPIGQGLDADPWQAASHAVAGVGGVGTVARIKATVRPEDILGIARVRRPTMIRCPLHHDTHPSLCIWPDGRWRCFGCARGGDVFDLVAALRRLTNREAIAALAASSK